MSKKLIECKSCGHQMAKSAKSCPQCGAKNKKPIIKKWWFWVAVILVVTVVGSSGNEPENVTPTSNNVTVEAPVSAENVDTSKTEKHDSDDTATTIVETEAQLTLGEKNALASAKNYLRFTAFSYEGLISQLEFEQYSREEAVYAADHCGADWCEQALKSAKNYLSFSAFSYDGLIRQLEFEKYTNEQAVYAVDHCGADWFEQAAKCAKNYLEFTSFSKAGLIDQLEFEGFTLEQATYGAEANGY